MNHPMILSYIITFLGVFLCAFSSVFIYLGRPIAGDSDKPQILRYKGLEVRTNSIIALLLVSAVVAVLPLSLLYLKPPTHAVTIQEPTKPISLKLYIIGRVDDESSRALSGAKVTLFNVDGKSEIKPVENDGSFDFPAVTLNEGQTIKLKTEKDGYRPQHLILGVSSVNYPLVLARDNKRR